MELRTRRALSLVDLLKTGFANSSNAELGIIDSAELPNSNFAGLPFS